MIATKEMPVTVGVFVRPGDLPTPLKGTQCRFATTVSPTFLGKTISLCARKGNVKIVLARTNFPPVLLLDINGVNFIPDSGYPCDAKCIGM